MYDIPWLSDLLWVAAFFLYGLPTIIARFRPMRTGRFPLFAVANLLLGWTIIGWFYLLREALNSGGELQGEDPPPPVRMDDEPTEARPGDRFAEPIARLLELPPQADRTLSLRLPDGRGVRLVRDGERPLSLHPEGPWTASQQADARALLQTEVETRPDLVRAVDGEDPLRGVEFPSANQYSASGIVHRLATEVLGAAAAEDLELQKNYEDYDARPEIASALNASGSAELLHEASGVRVVVELLSGGGPSGGTPSSPGYRLEVPVESLDPRRGHRARARQTLTEARWRFSPDGDYGAKTLADEDTTWGYEAPQGDARQAAAAALRLLCTITEEPIDVRVEVRDLSNR